MIPRLVSSRQWTTLPEEYMGKVQEVFKVTYSDAISEEHGEFLILGRIYPEEILLRIGYGLPNSLTCANFEVSLNFDPIKQKAQDLVELAVDAAGWWFDHYFEARDNSEYPREWQEFEMDDEVVYLRFTTVNGNLEAEADKLLGIDSALFNEEESLDAMHFAEMDTEPAEESHEPSRESLESLH